MLSIHLNNKTFDDNQVFILLWEVFSKKNMLHFKKQIDVIYEEHQRHII